MVSIEKRDADLRPVDAGFGWLGTFLLVVALVLVFGVLVVKVRSGDTAALDRQILLALRNPTDLRLLGPRWLPEFCRDLTGLGSVWVVWLVTAIVAGYLALSRKWADVVLIVVSVAGGQAFSTVTKLLIDRARPDLIPGAPAVFTASFPSGHALMSAVTYLTLGALLTRLEPRRSVKAYYTAVAVLLTVMIGVSRVALGVHWPTDVMAGWCVGAAWAIVCSLVAGELLRRRELELLG